MEVMKGLAERGTDAPVLLRFRDLLCARIDELNKSFIKAIKAMGYKGKYRGVYLAFGYFRAARYPLGASCGRYARGAKEKDLRLSCVLGR